jgi:predicted peroxiredoxin
VYGWAMKTTFMCTSGSSDPTKASIPLHLAVNGCLEVGHTVDLVLAGDATELVKPEIRETISGVGVPPARELFAKARQHGVAIHV